MSIKRERRLDGCMCSITPYSCLFPHCSAKTAKASFICVNTANSEWQEGKGREWEGEALQGMQAGAAALWLLRLCLLLLLTQLTADPTNSLPPFLPPLPLCLQLRASGLERPPSLWRPSSPWPAREPPASSSSTRSMGCLPPGRSGTCSTSMSSRQSSWR